MHTGTWNLLEAVALTWAVMQVSCLNASPATEVDDSQPGSAAAQASPGPDGLTKLRLRYTSTNGQVLPFFIAREAKLYQKYGLDVQVEVVESPALNPAVLAGEADLAPDTDVVVGNSAEVAMAAMAQGAKLVFIGSTLPYEQGFLMVRPEIGSIRDLKGKPLLVVGFNNGSALAIRQILAGAGLDPAKDVNIVPVQQGGAQMTAAATGQVAGFMATPPEDLYAERAGLHVLYDVSSLRIPETSGPVITNRSYLKAHRATLLKFMQATTEAVRVMKSDSELAIATFMKDAKLDNREAAARTVQFYQSSMPDVPAVRIEGLKTVQQNLKISLPLAADLDLKTVYDTSLTDQIEMSGFTQNLAN